MSERANAVDFFGLRSVVGPELKPGDRAPSFKVIDNGMKEVDPIQDSAGKVRIFSVAPSLDTSVCDIQTRRFNVEASNLGDGLAVYAITADLPFAQKRWCGAAGASRVTAVSDHRDMAFGAAYGTFIKDFRLEQRAVFVVDQGGVVRHAEYVVKTGTEPNYDAALKVAKDLLQKK
jgi:thiol peroxidase